MSPTTSPAPAAPREGGPPPLRILLGAQRFAPNVAEVAAAFGVEGPFATITAGWQAREDDDGELDAHFGGQTVNLRLYARTEQVFSRDPELFAAHRSRQVLLKHRQDFYRIRLERELEVAQVIRTRKAPRELLEEAEDTSIAALRLLDRWHLAKCGGVEEAYEAEWRPAERPAAAEIRAELAEALAGCRAVAIAGGHVAALMTRLRLFDLGPLLAPYPIVAWSAGAMALTDRVVLFHDRPPQGPGAAEMLATGLGLVPGLVALPAPQTRLRLDDTTRVALMVGRFEPARCVGLPARAWIATRAGALLAATDALSLRPDGEVRPLTAPGTAR